MKPVESSVSNASIWNIYVELSITVLEASFALIDDVSSTDITYDDGQLAIVICL
jgi:hypothetical protein